MKILVSSEPTLQGGVAQGPWIPDYFWHCLAMSTIIPFQYFMGPLDFFLRCVSPDFCSPTLLYDWIIIEKFWVHKVPRRNVSFIMMFITWKNLSLILHVLIENYSFQNHEQNKRTGYFVSIIQCFSMFVLCWAELYNTCARNRMYFLRQGKRRSSNSTDSGKSVHICIY